FVDAACVHGAIETALVSVINAIIAETGTQDSAVLAFEQGVQGDSRLVPAVARQLETQIALWHRDQRNDLEAAEAALLRAVGHDSSDAATLEMLRQLQRRAPDRALVTTLLRLA